jgi:hypothetical protein
MRSWAWALALVTACDDDDTALAVLDRSPIASGFDAGAAPREIDSGEYVASSVDGSTPTCPPLDVCQDDKPGLLYNVCITGSGSGALSQPACLVDPNGVLYLAPLTTGQLVMSEGWTQSTNASLSAADQARCESARAALLIDASTLPKCAGGATSAD